ncbi:MAG: hypothetical protein ABI288_08125 [Ginsengibacter sp.]
MNRKDRQKVESRKPEGMWLRAARKSKHATGAGLNELNSIIQGS